MVFSSVSFLVFFLPILLIVYFIVPKRFRGVRNFILLAASLVFYGWGGPKLLLLLLASVAINYVCGLFAAGGRETRGGRLSVAAAAVLGLGLLGWFKYAGFFAETVNALGIHIPVPQVVLPIGISFFTFQGLSYVIDVYRGDAQVQKNPLNVALYVALFPQLVAGPIVRYTTVAEDIKGREESVSKLSSGIVRFLFGLSKKMLLANAMGEIADEVFSHPAGQLGALIAWVGIIAYTAQIYFDFSAYSDMAIGLGRMFGFEFLENFNYPYIAKSVTEFWRRWHISLSSWFRDYVYIPLGGNRCSKYKHIRNIAVVWLLTGLWHGANWTFVLWGLWFCLLLLGEKYLWGRGLERLPSFLRHTYTMLAVMVSWVLFRSDSVSYAVSYLGAMFGLGAGGYSGEAVYYLIEYAYKLVLCACAALPVKAAVQGFLEKRGESRLCSAALNWGPKLVCLSLLALSYMELVTGSFNPFIYFQF
ncbi:MAG: MBOAT family O-acyltransferase [Oscillospiraceae bacterium]